MQVTMTPRGLQRISFVDHDDKPAILEQASGIDYGNPTLRMARSRRNVSGTCGMVRPTEEGTAERWHLGTRGLGCERSARHRTWCG